MADTSISMASTGTKKKKNVFKRFGKSIRRKKKKNHPDDESMYSFGSVGTGTGAKPYNIASVNNHDTIPETIPENVGESSSFLASTTAKPVRLVLLLVDPNSRRFELLQLEFDSTITMASVSDILRQIQCSATETNLRVKKYGGVCDQTGVQLIDSVKLSRFCRGDEIVLAMPNGMAAKDTAKLAVPILHDPKVKDMVKSSFSLTSTVAKPIRLFLLLMDPNSRRFELLQLEFDSTIALASDILRQIQCSATETNLRDMTYVGVCDQSGTEMIASVKLSRFCQGDEIVLAIPSGITAKDTAKLAIPILELPKVKDMVDPTGVQTQPQSKTLAGQELTALSSRNHEVGGSKSTETSISSILPTAILGVLIATLFFFHIHVSKPLESGEVLLPGQWKSQCGILDLVPEQWLAEFQRQNLFPEEWLAKFPMQKTYFSCNTSSSPMLELGRDGTLRYFTKGEDGKRKERWSMKCRDDMYQNAVEEEEQCFGEGAIFLEDGNDWFVEIDGTREKLNDDVVRDFTSER